MLKSHHFDSIFRSFPSNAWLAQVSAGCILGGTFGWDRNRPGKRRGATPSLKSPPTFEYKCMISATQCLTGRTSPLIGGFWRRDSFYLLRAITSMLCPNPLTLQCGSSTRATRWMFIARNPWLWYTSAAAWSVFPQKLGMQAAALHAPCDIAVILFIFIFTLPPPPSPPPQTAVKCFSPS